MEEIAATVPGEAQKVLDASLKFHTTQYNIFMEWQDTEKAKDVDFKYDVTMAGDTDKKKLWLETASELSQFPSWGSMQSHSSKVIALAETKDALTEVVNKGKGTRKACMGFLKSVQKSANDLKNKLDTIVNDIKRDGGQQQQAAAEEAEAHILQAAQDAQAPAVTETVRGPVVLTLFNAGVDKIPQVPFFSLPDVGSFTVDWVRGQLQGKDLCVLKVPYGVSAGLWLQCKLRRRKSHRNLGSSWRSSLQASSTPLRLVRPSPA